MALISYYDIGFATVANGSTAVTGTGTQWLTALRENDVFVGADGRSIRIASVNSATSLTLARAWPGASQTSGVYEVRVTPAPSEITASVRELLEKLRQGLWLTPNATGTLAERAAYDGVRQGFIYMRTDVNPFLVYIKTADTSGAWSEGYAPQMGPSGPYTTIQMGTVTTLAPDQPATITPVQVGDVVTLNFGIPRGPTGDITGVTPFWNMRLGSDADATAARVGLGVEDIVNPPKSLVDRLRGGTLSPELFTAPNGINEFDIQHIDGQYHFAFMDALNGPIRLRKSSTLAGLDTATQSSPFASGINYPAFLRVDGVWHMWAYNEGRSRHWTASAFEGPYSLVDSVPGLPNGFGDFHVRRFSDGLYYGSYKAGSPGLYAGLAVATSPAGPWRDLGSIFSLVGRGRWHAGEEADAAIFEVDGRVYCSFAGWDGVDGTRNQMVGLVELDRATLKAKSSPIVLARPTESWQQRNNNHKIFSPIFLRAEGKDRLFYSHNVSAQGTPTGWGFIEAGAPPVDSRDPNDAVRLRFTDNRDLAANLPFTVHGTAYSADGPATPGYETARRGFTATATPSGAYGSINRGRLNDFTFEVELNLPDSTSWLPNSNFARVFSLTTGGSSGSVVSLWINKDSGGNMRFYSELKNGEDANGLSRMWSNVIYSGHFGIKIERVNGRVSYVFNGQEEASQIYLPSIDGLREWQICNTKGASVPESQQFIGWVYSARCTALK